MCSPFSECGGLPPLSKRCQGTALQRPRNGAASRRPRQVGRCQAVWRWDYEAFEARGLRGARTFWVSVDLPSTTIQELRRSNDLLPKPFTDMGLKGSCGGYLGMGGTGACGIRV